MHNYYKRKYLLKRSKSVDSILNETFNMLQGVPRKKRIWVNALNEIDRKRQIIMSKLEKSILLIDINATKKIPLDNKPYAFTKYKKNQKEADDFIYKSENIVSDLEIQLVKAENVKEEIELIIEKINLAPKVIAGIKGASGKQIGSIKKLGTQSIDSMNEVIQTSNRVEEIINRINSEILIILKAKEKANQIIENASLINEIFKDSAGLIRLKNTPPKWSIG